MRISILIPVFNNLEYTKSCLYNLNENLTHPIVKDSNYTIILVDDGSNDGTSLWVSKHFPHVKILRGNGNLWWSGSINLGANYAFNEFNSDFVLWWNNDILVDNNFFINLQDILEKIPPDTIVGSKIMTQKNKRMVWSMGGYFDIKTGRKNMYGLFQPDKDEYLVPREVDWLTGMGTIIPKKVFLAIGDIDAKRFPQYYGDCDYTFSAKKKGFRLVVQPDLKIFNDTVNSGFNHENSFRRLIQSFTSQKSKYNIRKDLSFYRKHVRSPLAYMYLLKNYLKYILGFFKWKTLSIIGIKKTKGK